MLEQNWFVPYCLGFDDKKIFKEKLGILMFVQIFQDHGLKFYLDPSIGYDYEHSKRSL